MFNCATDRKVTSSTPSIDKHLLLDPQARLLTSNAPITINFVSPPPPALPESKNHHVQTLYWSRAYVLSQACTLPK